MSPVLYTPTQSEVDECVTRLASREVLGAYETITIVQTYVAPALRRLGYSITDLCLYAGDCAVVTVQEELNRFIRLEDQALISLGRSDDPDESQRIRHRKTMKELMRLLVGMRIHNDMAIV